MIFARRYHWQEVPPLDSTALLDWFVAHPEFLTYPVDADAARVSFASALVDPANIIWATYNDNRFTGIVILTKVVPQVSALLHFFFIDNDLASKRKLLNRLLGLCFTDLGFHRLSMEVPDRVVKTTGRRKLAVETRLERFARRALGFRLEGEIRDRHQELPKSLTNDWVARQGSRREQAYFDGSAWSDVVLLRLLASEWVDGDKGGRECLGKPYCQSPEVSSATSSEEAVRVTRSPSSRKTSSPSDSRTSGS